MSDERVVYQQWREAVQNKVAAAAWNATLSSMGYVGFQGNVLQVGVPSQVQFQQINNRHLPVLQGALRELVGDDAEVRVEITAPSGLVTPPQAAPEPIHTTSKPVGESRSAGLDPRMTFESFVTGQSNRLAQAASISTAETPGRNYNPLFIFGRSGLGKTHLLHAIGHFVQQHWPEKKVQYVTTETFLNDFIRAVREQSQLSLHDRYRSVDVLLIDDIQFALNRGDGFQEHIFNTFNALLSSGKQIVCTSDQSPREMAAMQERLRSRLLQGLLVEVGQPDLETRIAILQTKAESERVAIPAEVVEYIAQRVRDSIRELEGSVTMLRAHSQLLEHEITLEFAKKHLGSLGREQAALRTENVVDVVGEYFGFTATEIRGHKRQRPLAHARHIAMFLVRELIANKSYPVIAREFGNRNHTSIISAVDKIQVEIAANPQVLEEVTELRKKLTDGIF